MEANVHTLSRSEILSIAKQSIARGQVGAGLNYIVVIMQRELILTYEERSLFTQGCKKILEDLRAIWYDLLKIERETDDQEVKENVTIKHKQVQKDMQETCKGIFGVIERFVLPLELPSHIRVFYLKMQADFLCFLVDISEGEERERVVAMCLSAYNGAYVMSRTFLYPLNVYRVGCANNFAIFCAEVLEDYKMAANIAGKACREARRRQRQFKKEWDNDTIALINMMEFNIFVWISDVEKDQAKTRFYL